MDSDDGEGSHQPAQHHTAEFNKNLTSLCKQQTSSGEKEKLKPENIEPKAEGTEKLRPPFLLTSMEQPTIEHLFRAFSRIS